jgi:hypothetical protein
VTSYGLGKRGSMKYRKQSLPTAVCYTTFTEKKRRGTESSCLGSILEGYQQELHHFSPRFITKVDVRTVFSPSDLAVFHGTPLSNDVITRYSSLQLK